MKWNKIDEVWDSANPLFQWHFGLLSFRNCATMTMWRKDFSLLGSGKVGVLFYIHVPYQANQQLCVGPSISHCYRYFHFCSDSGLKKTMEPNIRQLYISTRLNRDKLISEHVLNVVCTVLYFFLSPAYLKPLYDVKHCYHLWENTIIVLFTLLVDCQQLSFIPQSYAQQIIQISGKREERLGRREEKDFFAFFFLAPPSSLRPSQVFLFYHVSKEK